MDSKARIVVKSLTWQLMGFVSMTLIGFAVTGSLSAGSGIAIGGAATGFVGYMLHEAVWSRVPWGRRSVP